MAIEVHPVARIRVEEETTFATDQTGSLGNFKEVPAVEGTPTLTISQEALNPGQLVQHIDAWNEKILGVKSASLSFDIPLAPTAVAADSSTTSVQNALGEMLKSMMGTETLAQGDTINDAGAAATDFDVSNISRWSTPGPPGRAVGLVNTSGILEVTEVESSSGSNLAFKRDFSFTPTNGATVYNSATYSMATNPTTTLQFVVEGIVSDDRWILLGCQMSSWSFTFEPGGVPRLSLTFEAAGWIHGEDGATNLTSSALGTSTYTNFSPRVLSDSAFIIGTVTAAARQSGLNAAAFSVTPNLSFQSNTSPGGSASSDIITSWTRVRTGPTFSGQFTIPFEDETWRNHKESKDDLYCQIEIGNKIGNMIVISFPTIQITDVQRVDNAGIASQNVSFEARLDTETSEGTASDFGQSVCRIHFM